MKLIEPANLVDGIRSSDPVATFVVLESGMCQIPVIASPTLPEVTRKSIEHDDDYMAEVYSYPLHEQDVPNCKEKIMNMRVDIKVRVLPNEGGAAPPSTPAGGLYGRPIGGAIAPPSTPTNSASNIVAVAQFVQEDNLQNVEIIDGNYSHYSRTKRAMLRNRSAPPVASQYRTRLATTSQWIKKRAVAELTSARNFTRSERPATSVRPFSEREHSEFCSPHMAKICIQPVHHPSQISMPDLGSFKGKTPISVSKRSHTKPHKTPTPQATKEIENSENPDSGLSLPVSDQAGDKSGNNKVDQYVSELRKTIKMRKPGLNGRKRLTPFAVWAISNSEDSATAVSPDLEKFEDETRRQEHLIDLENMSPAQVKSTAGSKAAETHAVRKEIIRQITMPDEKENNVRRNVLEVRGDIPPRVGNSRQGISESTTENSQKHKDSHKNPARNAFPRSKTTLSSAAKRGTKRYARQFLITTDAAQLRPQMLEKDIFQPKRGVSPSSNSEKSSNSRSLPYIKLQQSVTDYRTYKQNSAPFVRTLI